MLLEHGAFGCEAQFVWILLAGSSVRSELTSQSMVFMTFRLALLSFRGPKGHFLVPLPAGQIGTTLGLRRHSWLSHGAKYPKVPRAAT